MEKELESLKKMHILAHALNSAVVSEDFVRTIECLRRNTVHTERNKSGLEMSKDLANCMCTLIGNVKQLLKHSQLVLQQVKDLHPNDSPLQPIPDEHLKKIDNVVLSLVNHDSHLYRYSILNYRVFIERHPFEDALDYEDISKDGEAKETLDALSIIVATLNLVLYIVDQIDNIILEISDYNASVTENGLYLSLMLDMLTITHDRFMMYRYLSDHLKKTSKYAIRDKAIMLLCDEKYKGKDLLEVLDYNATFKPQPTFVQPPDKITFIYKSGYQKVLFQR